MSAWREAAAALAGRLEGLPPDGPPPHDLKFELRLAAGAAEHALPRPAAGRPVYEPPAGEVLYDPDADLLFLELGPRLRALCAPGRGRATVSALDPGPEELWLLSHPLFTLPLAELAKRRGLFPVHAGGVARGGRALLLAGASGSGKSTLALALLRSGLDFLGDDTLFLTRGAAGLRLHAFPDEVDLTDATVAFFPELHPLLAAPLPAGWRKRRLRAERFYGAAVAWECAPAVLVLPRVVPGSESRLAPIDPGEALVELVANVLLTDPVSSQAHLDALAELAAASRCYRLETGSDLDGAVRRLRPLLD
ncbi:MAG TPA: hypothetical protein VF121_14915 [Thermoanaerobaculia bacterium]|nr:hypothetical protein [Thermoanaerobaculia bacterium]